MRQSHARDLLVLPNAISHALFWLGDELGRRPAQSRMAGDNSRGSVRFLAVQTSLRKLTALESGQTHDD
jgi:hypothetical protein